MVELDSFDLFAISYCGASFSELLDILGEDISQILEEAKYACEVAKSDLFFLLSKNYT